MITDHQIRAWLHRAPQDHWARQWATDALTPSTSHPNRQKNARREIAKVISAEAKASTVSTGGAS